ncbi:MAG TPA: hypothetical protein QGF58_01460 [Myxococcota bacterium]|nr:hypothetical protein [Myxococcota bacterium]
MIFSLIACNGPGETEVVDLGLEEEVQVVSEPLRTPELPRFSQEDLASRDDVVTLSGSLACDQEGPLHVRVFPPHPDDANRRFDSHPRSGFLSEVVLDAPGEFSVKVPLGRARLLLAWRDADGDGLPSLEEAPFFADPHGRAMDLDADVGDLVLDCAVYPTRATDNTRTAEYGERGQRAPASLRLEAEGLGVYGDPGQRNPTDIEDILELARQEGIDVDGDGAPMDNSKFSDGAM